MTKKINSITLICVMLACIFLPLGYIFVISRQFEEKINVLSLIVSCLAAALTTMDFAGRWHDFIFETRSTRSAPFFLYPFIGAVILYCATSGNPFRDGLNLVTLAVCVLNIFIFVGLNFLLTCMPSWLESRIPRETNAPLNSHTERVKSRFVIVLPLVFISMQEVLLGASLAISLQKNWLCCLLYGTVLLYLGLWLITVSYECSQLEKVNKFLLVALGSAIAGYLFLYYTGDGTGWLVEPGKALVVKAFALALASSISISIPALMDLSGNIEVKMDMTSVFERHHVIISLLTGTVSFFFYVSWVLMAYSHMLLFAFAIASTVWVRIVVSRRESSTKKQHVITAILGPLLASVFLCCEFLGWWDGTVLKISVSVESFKFSEFALTFTSIVSLIWEILKDKEIRKGLVKFPAKVKEAPIFWVVAFSHVLTAVALWALPSVGANPGRIYTVEWVLIIQIFAEFLMPICSFIRRKCFSGEKTGNDLQ